MYRELDDDDKLNIMLNNHSRDDAIRLLKNGATILDGDYFEENLDRYIAEELYYYLDTDSEEYQELLARFKRMIDEKIPVEYWEVTEYEGHTYYIMLVL